LKNYQPIGDRNPNAVPWVPEVIKIIAEHFEMPNWKLFRPVLAQWWS